MAGKVLLTGSSGFIGSHLLRALLDRGYTTLGIDRNPPGEDVPPHAFAQCDLLDHDRLSALMREFQPEFVLHLAARIDVDGKELSGYSTNIEGVQNLVDAVRATPGVHRAIYTSSQLVCRIGHVPRHDTDYAPDTVYGESKALTEKIVREHDGGGVEWCIVRPTTVWGPGMSPHYQGFLRMIRRGTYFHVGRRPLYKSYSYVGNIVHQYLRLMEAPRGQVHGRTFYLADYQPISLREWTTRFQEAMGASPIHTLPEGAAALLARTGDLIQGAGIKKFPFTSFRLRNVLTEYTFDLSQTEAVCGPLPYTMREGVEETVRWLESQGGQAASPGQAAASRTPDSGHPAEKR